MAQFRRRFGSTLTLLACGTFTSLLALPTPRTLAADYGGCAASLKAQGLSEATAAAACAGSLDPGAVSSCVGNLTGVTKLSARELLDSCRSVRRPGDFAACVGQIQGPETNARAAVEGCRLSLLPDRYASCVLGLADGLKISRNQAIPVCSENGDSPRELNPPYQPVSSSTK